MQKARVLQRMYSKGPMVEIFGPFVEVCCKAPLFDELSMIEKMWRTAYGIISRKEREMESACIITMKIFEHVEIVKRVVVKK